MPRPWEQSMCSSLLADRGTLASQVMEFTGFAFTEQDKGVPIASLRKNLEDKAGWDKNDIKAIRVFIGPKTLTAKLWGI